MSANSVERWDVFWRWESFRRRCDPVDARRWKRDSQRELWERFGARDPLVLDATLGLGDHALNLCELGFRTEGCDGSALALSLAREMLAREGARVATFEARWASLGEAHAGRYGLIFHDALHWIYERDDLLAALRGLHAALAPGGAMAFFFAEAKKPDEGEGLRVMQWELARLAEHEDLWSHEREETRVTCARRNVVGADYIDQVYSFAVSEPGVPPRVEETTLRRVYRWDWFALGGVLREAGFADVRSEQCRNALGEGYALNLAYRAG